MGNNKVCPACGAADVKKLIYTSQGGILWTPFLNFFKCRKCGVRFSGKTGQLDPQVPKGMRIVSVLVVLVFLGMLIGFALSFSSYRQPETSAPMPTIKAPSPHRR